MSDKPFNKLTDIDQRLRRIFPTGMLRGTQVIIRKIVGFELFNTRPYHNYETWSDGYEVTDGEFITRAEDLDAALDQLVAFRAGAVEKIYPGHKLRPEDRERLGPFVESDQ